MHFLSSGGPSSVEADGMASRIRTRGTSSLQLPSSVSNQKRCRHVLGFFAARKNETVPDSGEARIAKVFATRKPHHSSSPPAKVRPAPTLQKIILSPGVKMPSSAAQPRAIETLAALVLPYLAMVTTNLS